MIRETPKVISAGALALVLITGCTGGAGNGESSAPPAEKVVDVTDEPGTQDGHAGAIDDSTLDECEVTAEALVVSGTVTNPEDSPQSYRIYVSAMRKKETLGLVQVDVDSVGPGDSADWSTEIDLADPELECVLRVERFDP